MRLFLALGSNLGNRLENLRFARQEIMRLITQGPLSSAGLYESAPVDCPEDSPPFLNTVISGETSLLPLEILALTQSIESAAGRQRGVIRNAPRVLDIDLLLLDGLVLRSPSLSLPHPRLHLRRFVLHPLADLAPQLLIPETDQKIIHLRDSFSGDEPPPVRIASCW